MKGKGLTMEIIVQKATELVVQKGYNNFSMRELAKELECKAASLYNYVTSIDDINFEIGRNASMKLNDCLDEAARGKTRDEAVRAVSKAYRNFIRENNALYTSIMAMPSLKHTDSTVVGRLSMRVFPNILKSYQIREADSVSFSRMLRASIHGYVQFEISGYYSATTLSSDESFTFMIESHIRQLLELERAYIADNQP